MQRIGKTVVGLLSFTMLAAGGVAHAATLYVDQTFGVLLASGQFRNIRAAVDAAQSGDTVQVAAGDYAEAFTISQGVTLLGSGPQYTRINNTITINTGSPVTISGFTVSSAGEGILIAAQPSEMVIKNNCIVGNGLNGIRIKGTDTAGTVTIVNNTIDGNGGIGVLFDTGIPCHVTAINNIVTNNGSYGFRNGDGSFSTSRNLVYGNRGSDYSYCASWGWPSDYCRVSFDKTDNLLVDPNFAAEAGGDFTLQSSSPARNQGKVGVTYLNPDGTRNDMGAFGGPGAAAFWPYGYGPVVTAITAVPARVTQGGSITINATATVR